MCDMKPFGKLSDEAKGAAGWIEHNGLNVPEFDGKLYEVKRRGGKVRFKPKGNWRGWLWDPKSNLADDILYYRVRPS